MKSMPSRDILAATSAIKKLKEITVIGGWKWYPSISKWVLKCIFRINSSDIDMVPNTTNWYIMIDDVYPNGDVDFQPSKENGITLTFQHQFYNRVGKETVPWRNGRICSKTDLFYLSRREYDFEPFESHERLKWHIERTLSWLYDASKGTLVDVGDPFELPDFDTTYSPFSVIHFESPQTLSIWMDRIGEAGIVHLGMMHKPKGSLIVLSFNDVNNKVILDSTWNGYVRSQITRLLIGTWVLLPDVVVLRPWQVPMTWIELRQFVVEKGLDYARFLTKLTWPFTWDSLQFMLLGFPIPEKWGGDNHQIHWQALRFPMLENTDPDEHKWLHWQKSENWHPNQIHNRGMFGTSITEEKIIVIGAGAIGSMVSEMLVRGGAKYLTIVDDERIEVGNLTRHTLSLNDVGRSKAEALDNHLTVLSPHARVEVINTKFEKIKNTSANSIREHGIIIDTTGNDNVLFYLENFHWAELPFFCSISIGLKASRLYVLLARKHRFPRAFFMRHVKRWLEKDIIEDDDSILPRSGGIGCWHPAFPARIDDMWLLSSAAIKYMERYISANKRGATFGVFEKVTNDGSFEGIRLVCEHHDNG